MYNISIKYIKDICNFLDLMGFLYSKQSNQMNILGLQGVSYKVQKGIIVNDNEPNKYNDLIILFSKKEVMVFRGTLDPGSYYTKISDEVAHLAFAHHRFVKGLHQQKYKALRAYKEQVWIYRDKNKDYKPTPKTDAFYKASHTGINIHAGGKTDYINKWSAGCINICGGWDGLEWKSFMEMIDNSPKNLYDVILWSGKDFLKYIDNEEDVYRPTLFYSCICDHVGAVQKRLGIRVDNIFGKNTHKKVMQFQKESNLLEDGIVGDITWRKLI